MRKYRVVQTGTSSFVIQYRALFIWFQGMYVYTSLHEATKRIDKLNYVTKVVYETEK
jgi:hypothetical protein